MYPECFETDEQSAMKAVPDIKLRDAPPKKKRRKAPPRPPLLPSAVPQLLPVEDPRLIPLPPSPSLPTQSVEGPQPVSLSLSPVLMPTQDMDNHQLIPLPPVPLWMIPPAEFNHTQE